MGSRLFQPRRCSRSAWRSGSGNAAEVPSARRSAPSAGSERWGVMRPLSGWRWRSRTAAGGFRCPSWRVCLKNRGRFLVYLVALSSTRAMYLRKKGDTFGHVVSQLSKLFSKPVLACQGSWDLSAAWLSTPALSQFAQAHTALICPDMHCMTCASFSHCQRL